MIGRAGPHAFMQLTRPASMSLAAALYGLHAEDNDSVYQINFGLSP